MRLIRPHKHGTANFKDHLGDRSKYLIAQPTLKHSNDTPHPRLKAMFPTQSGWQGNFIEY